MQTILTSIGAFIPALIIASVFISRSITKARPVIIQGKLLLGLGVLVAVPTLILVLLNSGYYSPVPGELLRFDTLSVTMFLMVSIIGFIVIQFSGSYLQGETDQAVFIRKLLLTIAFVQLLVLSGNLLTLFISWVATSFSLQSLIIFYKERKEARQAVRKKFIVARMSDLSLLVALLLLYVEFGTVQLSTIFQGLNNLSAGQVPLNIELSGLFLILAAIIKSVQIPFHGWILDVMEAPTPVSALLHAGLLNAGPFLIIRFSYLMEITSVAPVLLLIAGGASALYGTLVFPTQPSIKTGLAYSSIGHMGFSLMISGMGLYSAALLHLVAHSFYKARSFLSSGSAIDKYRIDQMKGNHQFNINKGQLIAGILFTGVLSLGIISLFNQNYFVNFQMIVLSVIIVVGVSSFMIKTSSIRPGLGNLLKAAVVSGFVLLAFFLFEHLFKVLLGIQVPAVTEPGIVVKSISAALVLLFTVVVYASMFSSSAPGTLSAKWKVYQRNGFYIHLFFDRFVNSIASKLKIQNYETK